MEVKQIVFIQRVFCKVKVGPKTTNSLYFDRNGTARPEDSMDNQTSVPFQERSRSPANHGQTGAPVLAQGQAVALVTDSVAQVPVEVAFELGISVVPMAVQIDGRPYQDGVDLDLTELYYRMRNEKIVPTTIAPTPKAFQEAMVARLRCGAKAVLCITLSSRLSSSYQNACLAAELVREDDQKCTIEVLDSLKAAASEGFIVTTAARAAARGEPMQTVLEAAREAGSRTNLIASFETLEYLARGGRIGKAAYLMASLIHINPIVTIDKEGTVSPVGMARSTKQALQVMVDYVAKQVTGCQKLTLTILEADASEQAARLRDLACQLLQPAEIHDSVFTPVMGVHTGPGLIGLAYSYE
jgi:DegV family protein with EDD domain